MQRPRHPDRPWCADIYLILWLIFNWLPGYQYRVKTENEWFILKFSIILLSCMESWIIIEHISVYSYLLMGVNKKKSDKRKYITGVLYFKMIYNSFIAVISRKWVYRSGRYCSDIRKYAMVLQLKKKNILLDKDRENVISWRSLTKFIYRIVVIWTYICIW